MDKIYSRPRIKLPKIVPKKGNKIRFFIFIILISILISVISFIWTSYPILIASCETAAASKATEIVTTQVDKVMSNYSYDELVDIEKDEKGNVTLMKANVSLMNKITSEIVGNIQKQIDNSPTTMVYINYGSVSRN